MIIVRHTHIIKKGEIYQKPKTLIVVGRGDLFSNVENNKGFTSRTSELQKLCLALVLCTFKNSKFTYKNIESIF